MSEKYTVPSRYLPKTHSFTDYGREVPHHFQDDMTRDILKSASMHPREALMLANDEHRSIKALKEKGREDDGEYMYQIKQLENAKKMVDQTDRSAKFYERYKNRNTKRMTPSQANDMVQSVSMSRRNRGGKVRKFKNKTRRGKARNSRKRKHHKRR